MKPLSERDENSMNRKLSYNTIGPVGMKPLSERDENPAKTSFVPLLKVMSRNEATL